MILTRIADKYGSDKGTYFTDAKHPGHLYTPFYDQLFEPYRLHEINLFEVGVSKGASVMMWNEYFPNGNIVGMDNNLNQVNKDAKLGVEGGGWHDNVAEFGDIELHHGDQGHGPDLLRAIDGKPPFDIMIDDGSHRDDHQQNTFGVLFPYLKAGGYYIIEDIHVSGSGIGGMESQHSTMTMIYRWMVWKILMSELIPEKVSRKIEPTIDWLQLYFRHNDNVPVGNGDAFCVIKKKENHE